MKLAHVELGLHRDPSPLPLSHRSPFLCKNATKDEYTGCFGSKDMLWCRILLGCSNRSLLGRKQRSLLQQHKSGLDADGSDFGPALSRSSSAGLHFQRRRSCTESASLCSLDSHDVPTLCHKLYLAICSQAGHVDSTSFLCDERLYNKGLRQFFRQSKVTSH